MTTLVLVFIGIYYIELLYRRILLGKLCEIELNTFKDNFNAIVDINKVSYSKLGQNHLYK